MFDKFFDRLFNGSNEKEVKKIRKIVEQQINPLEDGLKKLSDSSLANKTNEFKARLAKGETLDDILPEAFAVVREASRRVLGMPWKGKAFTSLRSMITWQSATANGWDRSINSSAFP